MAAWQVRDDGPAAVRVRAAIGAGLLAAGLVLEPGSGTASEAVGLPLWIGAVTGLAAGCGYLLWPDDGDGPQKPDRSVVFDWENDKFGGNDGGYTNGLVLGCSVTADDDLAQRLRAMPLLGEMANIDRKTTLTFRAGQNIYTPDSLRKNPPDPDDRPYAGYLYWGFGLETEDGPWASNPETETGAGTEAGTRQRTQFNVYEVQVGVVGPSSHAHETQDWFHEAIGQGDYKGHWQHQLNDEPTLNLFFDQVRQGPLAMVLDYRDRQDLWDNVQMDVRPYWGFALGNVLTAAHGGFAMRLGWKLPEDFGPAIVRPNLPGSNRISRDAHLSVYGFGAAGGRVVAHDIFLDGNTFRDCPNNGKNQCVDKKNLVGDTASGVVVQYKGARLAFTYIWRTAQFDGDHNREFGGVSLGYSWRW